MRLHPCCSIVLGTALGLLAAAVPAQDSPQVAGPPAPPPLSKSDLVGIWHIDTAATGENMLAALKGVEGEQLKTNKSFYAVVLEALKDSEYRLYADGRYRARVGGKTKIGISRGTWRIDGQRVELKQSHLDGKPKPETHLAELRDGKIVFVQDTDSSSPSFVLARDPLSGPWVVDEAATRKAIDAQVESLSAEDADVRRTALDSVLAEYRTARFQLAVDNRWRATLGSGDAAVRLEGTWHFADGAFQLEQTERNGTPAAVEHQGKRDGDRLLFDEPNFTLVLVPAAP